MSENKLAQPIGSDRRFFTKWLRESAGEQDAGEEKGEATAPPLAVAPFDAAAAKGHQEAWAKHLGVPVKMTNSIGMKMVLIPAGVFQMGSPESDSSANPDEKPQHTVRITKPFHLGATDVNAWALYDMHGRLM